MRAVALPLLGFALLAGCGDKSAGNASGGAPSASASASAPAACSVLTEADAEKALGHKVKKLPATGGAGGFDICQYGWEGEHIADTGNVSVTVHANPLSDFRKSVGASGMAMEPVAGVGDGAFWTPAGLYVGKGSRTGLYIIGGAGIADQKAAAVALAKATVDRL